MSTSKPGQLRPSPDRHARRIALLKLDKEKSAEEDAKVAASKRKAAAAAEAAGTTIEQVRTLEISKLLTPMICTYAHPVSTLTCSLGESLDGCGKTGRFAYHEIYLVPEQTCVALQRAGN